MEDEDLAEMNESAEASSKKPTKRKQAKEAERLSDSDEDMDELVKDQKKAEKHKRLFEVTRYEPIACLARFNPLEIRPKSHFVAQKL